MPISRGRKSISGARAAFPDAAKAGEAKATVEEVRRYGGRLRRRHHERQGPPELAQLSSAMPAIRKRNEY